MSRIGRMALVSFVLMTISVAIPSAHGATISDFVISPVDGARIFYTLTTPGAPCPAQSPVIMIGHGWSGNRRYILGTSIGGTLVANCFATLTWDARGFGESGGDAQVNSLDYEVQDVGALIDMLGARADIQKDVPSALPDKNDPRVGMYGVSYGGAIQLMTASADPRVDAIAPQIAYNDIPQSLRPGGVLKIGWDLLLYGAGVSSAAGFGLFSPGEPQTGTVATEVHKSFAEGAALNDWTEETVEWFDLRSPKNYVSGAANSPIGEIQGVQIPTLVIQGINDTLLTPNEGIANWRQISSNGVPTKLMLVCGSLLGSPTVHSVNPLTSCQAGSAGSAVDAAVLKWFNAYVKNPPSATDDLPAIRYQLQDGSFATASDLPKTTVSATGTGLVGSAVAPTSGAVTAPGSSPDGIRVGPIPLPQGATALGVPKAAVTTVVVGLEAFLFFKILDVDASGRAVVVDDQIMAKRVPGPSLDPVTFEIGLGAVSWKPAAGHTLWLEISSTSNDHASSRTPFVANVSNVTISVPYL